LGSQYFAISPSTTASGDVFFGDSGVVLDGEMLFFVIEELGKAPVRLGCVEISPEMIVVSPTAIRSRKHDWRSNFLWRLR